MRAPIALTVPFLLAIPGVGTAQPWREAYDRGEYTRAAELLHAAVLERDLKEDTFPALEPAVQLAKMYLTGTGVKADRLRACGLLFGAMKMEVMTHYNPFVPKEKLPVARLYEEQCKSLSLEELGDSISLLNCFNYGLEPEVFVLDPGHSVDMTWRGITIHFEGTNSFHETTNGVLVCAQQFADVRHTRVDPPPDAEGRTARHFLEFFAWTTHWKSAKRHRALNWQLWEVLGHQFLPRWQELLLQDDRSAWPPSEVPANLRRVTFRMRRNGQVLWSFPDTTQRGGLEALPIVSKPK